MLCKDTCYLLKLPPPSMFMIPVSLLHFKALKFSVFTLTVCTLNFILQIREENFDFLKNPSHLPCYKFYTPGHLTQNPQCKAIQTFATYPVRKLLTKTAHFYPQNHSNSQCACYLLRNSCLTQAYTQREICNKSAEKLTSAQPPRELFEKINNEKLCGWCVYQQHHASDLSRFYQIPLYMLIASELLVYQIALFFVLKGECSNQQFNCELYFIQLKALQLCKEEEKYVSPHSQISDVYQSLQ